MKRCRNGIAVAPDSVEATRARRRRSEYNGKIVACLQDDTYSYFQTGIQMAGTHALGRIH